MAISQTTISGPVYMPNGATPVGGKVQFELTSWDKEDGEAVFVSGPYTTDIDENGQFSVDLFTTTEGTNSVNYRMYVSWFDSTGAGDYINGAYDVYGTEKYVKEYIGSFALAGPGPYSISDLTIVSELAANSFDVLAECAAYATSANNSAVAAATAITAVDNAISKLGWWVGQDIGIAQTGQSNAGSAGGTTGNGIQETNVFVKLDTESSMRLSSTNDKPYFATELARLAVSQSGGNAYVTITFKSGTPIDEWVDKDGVTGPEWADFDAECAASFAETGVKKKIVIFSQGEADSDKAGTGTDESDRYAYQKAVDNFKALVKAAAWSDDRVVILFTEPKRGGMGAWPTDDRADVHLLAGFDDPYVGAVSSFGLTDPIDNLHFQDAEIKEIGYRAWSVAKSLPSAAYETKARRLAPIPVPIKFFGGANGVNGTLPDWATECGITVSVTTSSAGVYNVECSKRIAMLIVNQDASQTQRRQAMTAPVDDFNWMVETYDSIESTMAAAPEAMVMNGILLVY